MTEQLSRRQERRIARVQRDSGFYNAAVEEMEATQRFFQSPDIARMRRAQQDIDAARQKQTQILSSIPTLRERVRKTIADFRGRRSSSKSTTK